MDLGLLIIIGIGVFVACLIWGGFILMEKDTNSRFEERKEFRIARYVFASLGALVLAFTFYVSQTSETYVVYHGKAKVRPNPSGDSEHKASATGAGWTFWLNDSQSKWEYTHIYEIKNTEVLGFVGGSSIQGYRYQWYLKEQRDRHLDGLIQQVERKEN